MSEDNYKQELNKHLLKVLNFLSIKPRSEAEVITKLNLNLSKSNLSQDQQTKLLKEILDYLKEKDYLNDLKYVKEFIRQKKQSSKPTSTFKLKQFLLKKGIEPLLIDKELNALSSDFEIQQATSVAVKKLSTLNNLSKFEQKKRLYRYLASKGYKASTVYSVIDSLLDVK